MKKPVTLIVKRGALRRFDRLKRDTAALPVDLAWDRREGERRAVARASETDRRKVPPFTWDVADFVLVEKRSPQSRTRKKK